MNEINNSTWYIGNVPITGRAVLAPMAGVSDIAYRLLAKEHGAALVCTEMVSAMGIKYENEHTKDLLFMEDVEHPVSMQIFGSTRKRLLWRRKWWSALVPILWISIWAVRLKKVVSSGDGSALMKTPDFGSPCGGSRR